MHEFNNTPQKVDHVHRLEIGDNVFWLALWAVIATAIVLAISIAMQINLKETEVIAKSPDPIGTRCAMETGISVSQPCMILLANRAN